MSAFICPLWRAAESSCSWRSSTLPRSCSTSDRGSDDFCPPLGPLLDIAPALGGELPGPLGETQDVGIELRRET